MASYDEMKEAARREALGEQASKFYEMARPVRLRMGADSGPVEMPPSRDPLAGLPTDPRSAAELDARYAQVDRHLAAAKAAHDRIPNAPEYYADGAYGWSDKYGVGMAGSSFEAGYKDLDDLEKRGLISVSPKLRAEMDRVRGHAAGKRSAQKTEARELQAAADVSPMNMPSSYKPQQGMPFPNRPLSERDLQGVGGAYRETQSFEAQDPRILQRPPGVGPYSEPKKKK